MSKFEIKIAGDSAINLVFAEKISEQASLKIRAAAEKIDKANIDGIVEIVPTFCSCMVHYDPRIISFDEICNKLRDNLTGILETKNTVKKIFHIPVCYSQEFAPDIEEVAKHANISVDEVIEFHSSPDYLIDMLGFLPGFAYLGGLDKRLFTPRLKIPRTSIPAGSVGIGGSQTGLYPLSSPGGWRLIGRTPIKPYDPSRETPVLYEAGDYLHFDPISPEKYQAIEAKVEAGSYEFKIDIKGE